MQRFHVTGDVTGNVRSHGRIRARHGCGCRGWGRGMLGGDVVCWALRCLGVCCWIIPLVMRVCMCVCCVCVVCVRESARERERERERLCVEGREVLPCLSEVHAQCLLIKMPL